MEIFGTYTAIPISIHIQSKYVNLDIGNKNKNIVKLNSYRSEY